MDQSSIRRLLDEPQAVELFRAIPALAGRRFSGEFVRYWVKPGRYFNGSFRLHFDDGGSVIASAFAVGASQAAKILRKHVDRDSSAVAEPGLLLQLFPHDYRLPTLASCLDPTRINEAVGGRLPDVEIEPVGYWPGMRCQLRYSTPTRVMYGKVALEREPGRAFEIQARVNKALEWPWRIFRTPGVVCYLADLGLTFTSAVPGRSLHDLLPGNGDLTRAIVLTASALAQLHAVSLDCIERVYRPEDELQLLHGWIELAGELFPHLHAELRAREDDLQRTAPEGSSSLAVVHRDFYDKQLLLFEGGLSLLDLDTVCHGDAEIDIGNFAAHLWLRGLQLQESKRCDDLAATFVAAYPATVDPRRVRWYRRTALLRLACNYAMRPRWRQIAPAIIEECRRS